MVEPEFELEVELLCDWLPVEVVLSMVTLERPRRSMFGETVELEPLIDDWVPALEPIAPDPVVLEPRDVLADGDVDVVVLAVVSSMQSRWTGLDECSFAIPVALSASLPALGLFRLLHGGSVVVFVPVLVVALALAEGDVAVAERVVPLGVCASTGAAAIMAAAIAVRVRVCFIWENLLRNRQDMHFWDRRSSRAVARSARIAAAAYARLEGRPQHAGCEATRAPGRPRAPSPDGSGCGDRRTSSPPCAG